ncbi:MAG: SUMF1/EgtB/PvdO family nonheme iron enzyme, partial [Kiritimatiellae bacterium]|nr:SUMF1/EgtB/PvdO family nonheme iron enzyme [Kiritimatiellia bacterium]
YAPFYCMKYEITQGQYTDHLNHLEPGLAAARFPNAYGSYGHTIRYNGTNYICAEPDRACNFLEWSDVASCLDWSGLRPMTELEFEKVCRGPLAPVPWEYVWGDTLATPLSGVQGTDGSGTETPVPEAANCHGGDSYRLKPVRAGIFARPTSDRHSSGAGYYGVMELGGNVWECVIAVGRPAGRAYSGTHGSGGNLYTFPATWPLGDGFGVRGGYGGLYSSLEHLRTSDRGRIGTIPWRDFGFGGRGVRTAP